MWGGGGGGWGVGWCVCGGGGGTSKDRSMSGVAMHVSWPFYVVAYGPPTAASANVTIRAANVATMVSLSVQGGGKKSPKTCLRTKSVPLSTSRTDI